jgi:replicative DNA helicase
MSYLSVRAEQALIGAMLAERPLPSEMAYLRAQDLAHDVHRKLFEAIVNVRDHNIAWTGEQLTTAVALRVNISGVDASWLGELRDTCPEPAHIAAYARMIQLAAFRRDIAAHGERIAATANTGRATGETAVYMTKLAQALTRQAEVFSAYTVTDDTGPIRVSTRVGATGAAGETRAGLEDQILGDLLQHPHLAAELARALPSSTFTSGQRREIYETMVMLAEAGDLIDEIIVLWTLENQRGIASMFGDRPQWTPGAAEPDAAYLTRLAAMEVSVGTAVKVGQELVAADIREQLATAVQTVAAPQRPLSTPVATPLVQPSLTQPGAAPRLEL